MKKSKNMKYFVKNHRLFCLIPLLMLLVSPVIGAASATASATSAQQDTNETTHETINKNAEPPLRLDAIAAQNAQQTLILLHVSLSKGYKIGAQTAKDGGYPTKITVSIDEIDGAYKIFWPKAKTIELFPGYVDEGYQDQTIIPIRIDHASAKDRSVAASIQDQNHQSGGQEHSYAIKIHMDALLCSQQSCIPMQKTLQPRPMDIESFKEKISKMQDQGILDPDILPVLDDFFQGHDGAAKDPYGTKNTNDENHAYDAHNADNIWLLLLFAVIGGLILNIMPCVLPVLSLKLMKMIKTKKQDQAIIRTDFLQTALGIIIAIVLLGGVFAVIKLLGGAVGWGIHFQQPVFVLLMLWVLLYFTMATILDWPLINMDKIMARLPHSWKQYGRFLDNLLSGFLVVALSTPCTAPFLGTSLAFALSAASIPVLISIFFCVGCGLALPYLLVAAVPRMAGIFPKPGAWLSFVKPVFAFGFFITALWMFLILWEQLPETWLGAWLLLCFMACVGVGFLFAAWSKRKLALAMMGVLVLMLVSYFIPGRHANINQAHNDVVSVKQLMKIKQEILANNGQDRDQDPDKDPNQNIQNENSNIKGNAKAKVLFVDVTATWCLTCKWNKANVINSQEIQDFFKAHHVRVVTLDWTKKNDDITHYLSTFQRVGVPMNVVYGMGAPNGILLPEILSIDDVKQAVKKAMEKTGTQAVNKEKTAP
jgi:thiol:disulfide interchange protein